MRGRWAATDSRGRPGIRSAAAMGTAVALALATAAPGCKRKRVPPPAEPPHLVGLAAIPADATVVLSVDVESLAKSWLVQRALDQMFLRDPDLRQRLDRLLTQCAINPREHIDGFLIGLGGTGNRDAVMVVAGDLSESALVECVRVRLADDGGRLVSTRQGDRTYHAIIQPNHPETLWFSFINPRSVVVATAQEWLSKAVGEGPKLDSSPEMSALLARVDRGAGLWGIGQVDAMIGRGLVELTDGQVANPPRALFVTLELERGLAGRLGAVMASDSDAKYLKSVVKAQIDLGALALQNVRIGPLLARAEVAVEDQTVTIELSLTEDELKQLLSRIDTESASAQDPASGEPP